jgi:transposase
LRLDQRGRLDHDPWCVDAASIRASRSAADAPRRRPAEEPADHALGRSRGGFGTRLHLIVDGHGIPLSVWISPGQAHESRHVEPVLEAVRRPRRLAGDKGYSDPRVRRSLRRRGIVPVIPTRKDQRRDPRFDEETSRRRSVVERCVNWLKEDRSLGTRHEKLAVHFVAMARWAMIRRCLRLLDSPDRP